jgi:hypothetical protein
MLNHRLVWLYQTFKAQKGCIVSELQKAFSHVLRLLSRKDTQERSQISEKRRERPRGSPR